MWEMDPESRHLRAFFLVQLRLRDGMVGFAFLILMAAAGGARSHVSGMVTVGDQSRSDDSSKSKQTRLDTAVRCSTTTTDGEREKDELKIEQRSL